MPIATYQFNAEFDTRLAASGVVASVAAMIDVTLAENAVPGTDDQPRIQAVLNTLESAGGGRLLLGPGDYYIGPANGTPTVTFGDFSLNIGSNTTLEMADGCRLIKRCADSWVTPVIRNKNWTTGNTNIRVIGGTLLADNALNTGRLMRFQFVTGLIVERTKLRGVFGDWNFTCDDCTNVNLDGLDVDSGDGAGEDGLHFAGCTQLNIRNCRIICGDDCIAFIQEYAGGLNTQGVLIENCYLYSKVANMLRLRIQSGITQTIRDVTVNNCTGKCDGEGIHIEDENSANRISRVNINGFEIDCSGTTTAASGQPLFVKGASFVTIANMKASSPYNNCEIQSGDNIHLINLQVLTPRNTGKTCLSFGTIGNLTNSSVVGGYFLGATTDGILVGGLTTGVTGFLIDGAVVDDAAVGGISIFNGTRGIISGNRVKDCGGVGIEEILGATPTPNRNLFNNNQTYGNADNTIDIEGANSVIGGDNIQS